MLQENGERREKRVPQRNNASARNHVETGDWPVSRAKARGFGCKGSCAATREKAGLCPGDGRAARPHTTHNYTGVAVFRGGL